MLGQAGIDYTVIHTTHAGHAQELILNSDDDIISSITGIVVVGGDGVFHEVVNGLGQRQLLQRIKLGMVPCGTGSGLAASMTHASGEVCDVVSSCFLIWYV
jgi:sphingosine kinase